MSERGDGVLLPKPTAWPMVAALGVALLAAGLVTMAAVSALGAVLALAGAVGWAREVYPRPQEIRVPLPPAAHRARAVAAPAAGAAPQPGEGGHRMRLPVEIHPYSAGVRGGFAGAVAMALVALLYGLVVKGSPFYAANALASVLAPSLLGADESALRAFHGGGLLLALVIHALLSGMAGLVYAAVLPMLPGRTLLWGGVVAPILWTGVAWFALGIVNPTMDRSISWPWFLASQVAFGLVCGAVVARSERVRTLQLLPFPVRAGIEAAEGGPEERK